MTKETTQPLPPKQAPPEPDFKDRVNSFQQDLLPILGKYELGIAAMPKITPDGKVLADVIYMSTRYMEKSEAPDSVNPILSEG